MSSITKHSALVSNRMPEVLEGAVTKLAEPKRNVIEFKRKASYYSLHNLDSFNNS